jgi:ankyrin repeat protein
MSCVPPSTKSHISHLLLQTLTSAITVRYLQQRSKGKNVPVLFMYLNHKEKEKQTIENLLGSLLKQLIQYDETAPLSEDVKHIYLNSKKEARPSPESLIKVLGIELQRFPKAFLVVDALDESEEATRIQLLDRLDQLLSERTKLMVTQRVEDNSERAQEIQCDRCKLPSRNYWGCNICDIALCLSCKRKGLTCNDTSHELSASSKIMELEIQVPDTEMAAYVDWEINKEFKNTKDTRRMTTFGRLCYNNPQLREDIPAVVVAQASGMILLAKLYMDSLKSKLNLKQVEEALQTLPKKLEDTYVEAMQRIDAQPPEAAALARKVLSWLVYTRRPLSLIELQHVLAVDEHDKDFNYKAIFDKETILSRCANLVIVDTDELAVRLVHLTVQEYFDENPESHFPGAAKDIAMTCLTYLSFESFKEPCGSYREDISVSERLEAFPFLRYGSVYWGEHAQEAVSETVVVEKALQFFSDEDRLSSIIQAAYYTYTAGGVSWDVRKGVNGLHVSAWYGLDILIRELVLRDFDSNSQDGRGQTALMYACRRGHASTVALLLELGADVNIRSAPESTAMFEALAQNHIEVIKVLLRCEELDINAIQPHKHSRTALMLASSASEEREDVVECLLGRSDIDVNQQDIYGYTALSLAAEIGYYMIAETLLNKKDTEGNRVVDINSVNKTGSTALSLAAAAGQNGIVELLLDHDADTSIRDLEGGGTALMRAVDNGHFNIVKIMISRNTNTHIVDDLGRSLLHSASINGYADIVKFLVEMEDGLDPNLRDRNGLTALHDTARTGQPDVTKLLLELGAKSALKDKFDRTPYTVARQHGERRVMLILEGKPDITDPALLANLGPIPNASNLPVWSLAKLGLIDVIQNMINRESHAPDRNLRFTERDPDSNDTGLHTAILSSHPDILSLLVSQHKIPINTQNNYGRTPLHCAALCGRLDCTSILLEQPDVEQFIDVEDKWSTTALITAQQGGHFDVAVALISAGCAIDPLKAQIQGLFFKAVELANIKAVGILIERGADVLAKNLDGMTALQMTKEALREAEMLAGQGDGDDEDENGNENVDVSEELDRRKRLREVLQLLQNNKSFYQPLRTNSERSEESTSVRSTPKVTPVTSPQPENENGRREFAFRPRPLVV